MAKTWTVPMDKRDEIIKLQREMDLAVIDKHINKEAFMQAVKAGDRNKALEFRNKELRNDAEEKTRDELWKGLHAAIPEMPTITNLTFNPFEMVVSEKEPEMSGLAGLLGLGKL